MNKPVTALIVAGSAAFLAAKLIWDAKAETALIWAALIGGLGYWLGSLKAKPLASIDGTPEV